MRSKLYMFWQRGYLYISLSALVYLIYLTIGKFGLYDWQKEIAYFQYTKTSLCDFHTLPWIWWKRPETLLMYPAIAHSASFISNPETMLLSPLTPALFILDVATFVKFLIVAHFLIGVTGAVALRRRLEWGDAQFRVFAGLFLLSPIIIQHLTVGYTTYINLFFFPWLIYFVCSDRFFPAVAGTAAVLALVLLQGSVHVFIWFALLVAFFLCARLVRELRLRFLIQLATTFALAFLLGYVRIDAAARAYADFQQPFLAGYNPINFLAWALVPPVFVPPLDAFFFRKQWMGLPSWDAGVFWGPSLLFMLVLLVKFKNFRAVEGASRKFLRIYDALLGASLLLFILAFFSTFEYLVRLAALFHMPFAQGAEKYPFRLAIPAYLGFSVVIAAYYREISRSFTKSINRFLGLARLDVFYVALRKTALLLTIGAATFLIASFVFSRPITSKLHALAGEVYHGQGSGWVSRLFGKMNEGSLEHYYQRLDVLYSESQWSAGVVMFFSYAAFLFFQRNERKWRFSATEFALVFPLLFASAMWCALSVAVPKIDPPIMTVESPAVLLSPPEGKVAVQVSPLQLVLSTEKDSPPLAYELPQISISDSKILFAPLENARSSDSSGNLALIPSDNRPIHLTAETGWFYRSAELTAASWILTMVGMCLYWSQPLYRRRAIHCVE